MNDDVGTCLRNLLTTRLHARYIQLGPGQCGNIMSLTSIPPDLCHVVLPFR